MINIDSEAVRIFPQPPSAARDGLSVWWLTQAEYDLIDTDAASIPSYIASQVRSRRGRPGRGRLWVDSSIPWDSTFIMEGAPGTEPIQKWIDQISAGGIVVWTKDLPALRGLPGLVTNLSYERA